MKQLNIFLMVLVFSANTFAFEVVCSSSILANVHVDPVSGEQVGIIAGRVYLHRLNDGDKECVVKVVGFDEYRSLLYRVPDYTGRPCDKSFCRRNANQISGRLRNSGY